MAYQTTVLYGDYIFYLTKNHNLRSLAEVADKADHGDFEPLPITGAQYKGIKINRAPIEVSVDAVLNIDPRTFLDMKGVCHG
jgi:hypothetical protein